MADAKFPGAVGEGRPGRDHGPWQRQRPWRISLGCRQLLAVLPLPRGGRGTSNGQGEWDHHTRDHSIPFYYFSSFPSISRASAGPSATERNQETGPLACLRPVPGRSITRTAAAPASRVGGVRGQRRMRRWNSGAVARSVRGSPQNGVDRPAGAKRTPHSPSLRAATTTTGATRSNALEGVPITAP